MNLDINLIISLIPNYVYVENDGTTNESLIQFIENNVRYAYEKAKSEKLSSADFQELNKIVRQYYKPEACTEKKYIFVVIRN